MNLALTPLGEFINKYGVLVPRNLWAEIFRLAEHYLDDGSDWPMFFDELISGCQELRGGKLQEIICIMDEDLARSAAGERLGVDVRVTEPINVGDEL